MKKLILVILIFLLPAISIFSQCTEQQARAYWSTLTEDERIQFLMEAIDARNADPEMQDLKWYWLAEESTITVFPENDSYSLSIGSYQYTMIFEPITIEGAIPDKKFPWLETSITAAVFFIGGIILGVSIK